jgi:hypothetical protein
LEAGAQVEGALEAQKILKSASARQKIPDNFAPYYRFKGRHLIWCVLLIIVSRAVTSGVSYFFPPASSPFPLVTHHAPRHPPHSPHPSFSSFTPVHFYSPAPARPMRYYHAMTMASAPLFSLIVSCPEEVVIC